MTKIENMHDFKLGDKVYHKADAAPFEVVGVRKETVEIEGDWSGGTHNVCQKGWVKHTEIEQLNNVLMCEFSTLENEYKEVALTTEMSIEKAKKCLNAVHHDRYAEDMCRDWEFDGKFGKFFDECRWEEMYFRFYKPKYVA